MLFHTRRKKRNGTFAARNHPTVAGRRNGDPTAFDRLMELVYDELRRIARRYLARQPEGHTLQPTDLVNEAYVRLFDQSHIEWQSRADFFAFAATVMRHLLVDHARRKRRCPKVSLSEVELAAPEREAPEPGCCTS